MAVIGGQVQGTVAPGVEDVGVTPGVQQQEQRVLVASSSGQVKRRAARHVGQIRIGAAAQQVVDHGYVAVEAGHVEAGVAPVVARAQGRGLRARRVRPDALAALAEAQWMAQF